MDGFHDDDGRGGDQYDLNLLLFLVRMCEYVNDSMTTVRTSIGTVRDCSWKEYICGEHDGDGREGENSLERVRRYGLPGKSEHCLYYRLGGGRGVDFVSRADNISSKGRVGSALAEILLKLV